jgi:hypothetical protein
MILSVRIIALLIRYIKRMRRIMFVICYCVTLPHLSILSHTRHNFRKYIENKSIFFFFFTTSSEIFLIIRRAERYIIQHAHKSARYTCHVLINYNFIVKFKKSQISNIMKILSVGAEFVNENIEMGQRRTDIHNETDVCFSQFFERGAEI